MSKRVVIRIVLLSMTLPSFLGLTVAREREPERALPEELDPTNWGTNHVEELVPEYITGDQCLFCHRNPIGQTWPSNPHQLTIRPVDVEPEALEPLQADAFSAPMANEVEYLLGGSRMQRFLRRGTRYGTLELLTTQYRPSTDNNPGILENAGEPAWVSDTFNTNCAGCHTTGVDPPTAAFSDLSLDCFTCHGDASLAHSEDPSQMILAEARNDPPRVVASICGQCHIRSGQSKSTGRPYASNFIPGDNLFQDLVVDLSDDSIDRLGPGDRHILHNIRSIVLYGDQELSCLSCHTVHEPSTIDHQFLPESSLCFDCHKPERPKADVIRPTILTSKTCRY